MPDTLKQFYNASINVTGLTGNQTATLFTNNATTRAVIKDIDVLNTFPVQPNLTVAGTAVATLAGSLTGSEIADVSQAVGFSFPTPLSYTSTTLAYLEVSAQRASVAYNINGMPVSSTTVDQATPSLEPGASYVIALYYAPDGDVFSAQTNGDANWYMLKNAGSAGGTRTTINTGNTTNYSCIAFDGVNTFYWLTSSTNLRAFNADTETTTNTTIADIGYTATTQARLTHSNGYLWYQYTTGNTPYIIEISTGRWANFTGVAPQWDQANHIPGFWFEPSTRIATLMYFRSGSSPTNNYIRAVSPAIPAFTAASVVITTSWSFANLIAGSFQGQSAATGPSHIVLSSADGGVILNGSIIPSILSGISGGTGGWTIAALNSTNGATWRPRRSTNFSPTLNTTNFPNTISLRVTGVEVTP